MNIKSGRSGKVKKMVHASCGERESFLLHNLSTSIGTHHCAEPCHHRTEEPHLPALLISIMRTFTLIASSMASLSIKTSAFQATTLSQFRLLSCRSQRSINILYTPQTKTTLYQSEIQQDVEEAEEDLVEFFISAEQISVLRKEANKRDRVKKLQKYFLPQDESLELSQQSIDEITNLFEKSELIEVRGVSKGQKKGLFDVATAMAEMLEGEIGKPVVVVQIQGFAVKMYCPWLDGEGQDVSKRIKLFTSYKPGQWTRKPKPIRNAFGQIVMDENGKSVKEIPEY